MAKVTRTSEGGGLERIQTAIKELDKFKLMVGWLESAKYDDGKPVAGIAAVHEFGSPARGIPPRPFMRPTVENSKDDWIKLLESGARAILAGNETANSVMEKLGLLASGDIREAIAKEQTELSPITIALRKYRRDNPNHEIGGAFVGKVAAAIAAGDTGPGQLGDQSFGNKNPLDDTGYMLASLTYEVQV